MNYMVFSN